MDRSDIIELIAVTHSSDEYGVSHRVEGEPKTVMCDVKSVTRNEFFEGGRNGLNPEYEFDVFDGDYDGETIVVYKGKRYVVYRTYYGRTDKIELYVQREGGMNGSH